MSMINRQFKCDKEEWDKFKLLCKEKGSNASVELRRFIKEFNNENSIEFKEFEKFVGEVDSDVIKMLEIYEKIKKDDDDVLRRLAKEN